MERVETTELGLTLRELFIQYKQAPDEKGRASFYNIPPGHLQVSFEKAADLVRDLGANPDVFIHSQFYRQEDKSKILPQFLATSKAEERYLAFVEETNSKVTYDEIFSENVGRLKAQLKMGFSLRDILMSKTFSFRPWFRICISKEPIQEVIDFYKEAAKTEFNDDLKTLLIKHQLDYKRITL